MALDNMKTVGDAFSAAIVLGTLVQWLPTLAAALSVLWLYIQITRSDKGKQWIADQKALWGRFKQFVKWLVRRD